MSKNPRFFRIISCVLALVLALCLVQPSAAASTRISHAASQDGEVKDYQVASTGQYAVYSTLEPSYVPHLFSVALGGGAPVSLTTPLPAAGSYFTFPYQISPDGTRVIYIANQESATVFSLYSVPIAGGTPVRLSKTGLSVGYYAISPDSQWVLFVTYDSSNKIHFNRAALTGGTGSSVEFTPPGASPTMIDSIRISPDSQHFLYLGNMLPLGGWGIYCFPITGNGSQYVRLSMPVTSNWVMEYQVTPDSQRLVYRYTDESVNPATTRLYAVLINGPATSFLNVSGNLISGGGVTGYFQVSPDSRYLVFGAIKEVVNKVELYSYFLASRFPFLTSAVKLNVPIDDTKDINYSTFKISPNSAWVAYNAYQNNGHDLFSVPINGPILSNVKINQPVSPTIPLGWDDAIAFSPNSSHILFTSMQDAPDIVDLYSIPINSPASNAIKLNPAQVKNSSGFAIVRYPVFSPDGRWVFYTANTVKDRTDLIESPAQGPINKSLNLSTVSADYRAVTGFTQVPYHPKVVYTGPINAALSELYLADTQTNVFLPLLAK